MSLLCTSQETSSALLQALSHRRSTPPQHLGPPGPSGEDLERMLRLAIRVPDHGNLAPWRLIILEDEAKQHFISSLRTLADTQKNPTKALAALSKIRTPPLTVAVISRPVGDKIPLWEQQLSAGAVCMNLLMAAQALGFGATWITGWYAYDENATALLGLNAEEKVAGYLHVGTPTQSPRERSRPELATLASHWYPPPNR